MHYSQLTLAKHSPPGKAAKDSVPAAKQGAPGGGGGGGAVGGGGGGGEGDGEGRGAGTGGRCGG